MWPRRSVSSSGTDLRYCPDSQLRTKSPPPFALSGLRCGVPNLPWASIVQKRRIKGAPTLTPNGTFLFDLNSISLNIQQWNGTSVLNFQNVTLTDFDSMGIAIPEAKLTQAVNDAELISFDTSAISAFEGISGFQITPETDLLFSYVL